jgi:hypothetical protein
MPWKPLACVVLVACGFDASYTGGTYLCSDGVCPTGQMCVAGTCRPDDALGSGGDAKPIDASIDGPAAALTCASPGMLSAAGSATGSTVGQSSMVSALCGGLIQNGADAVYVVEVAAGSALHVAIAGDYMVDAYVLSPCDPVPATPSCEGNAPAMPGTPIVVTPTAAGSQFVVVDGENAEMTGTYTLSVSID